MEQNKSSKIISIVLVTVILVATLLAFLIPPLFSEKFDEELIVYNWADYIEPGVIKDFEEYYKELTGKSIKVVYTNFDTNETMLTEIIRGDSNIDVICPSEYAIQKLLASNALKMFDITAIEKYEKNYLGYVNPEITEKIDSVFASIGEHKLNMNDYFVPYMWGTLGILYNKNIVSEEQVKEAGWGIFWNSTNIAKLEQKILVKDSIRDIYVCAVMYLKEQGRLPAKYTVMSAEELINCTDSELLRLAEEVLKEQRPHIKGYEVDFGKDDMISNTAYVDLAWSGDAMYAIEEATDEDGNSFLDYYVPEIGSNIWFDGWVMPKNANNPQAGSIFVNYLCRPDIAMRNTMEIGYSMAINPAIFDPDAEEFDSVYSQSALDTYYEIYEIDVEDEEAMKEARDEYFGDIRRYPGISTDSMGMMQDFAESTEDTVKMWERVKASSEDSNWIILAIVIGVLGVIAVVMVTALIIKFKKRPTPRRVN